ncbi:MAG: hypothetical protein ABR514_01205 [Chthoniobacterales bacterium]
MRERVIRALALSALVFILHGCASGGGVVTESTNTQTAGAVPGEKIPDEGGFAPAPGANPNAGMRW